MELDFNSQLANFKDYIRRKYLSTDVKTNPINLGTAMQNYSLDVIAKIGLGKGWGFLASDSDVDLFIT